MAKNAGMPKVQVDVQYSSACMCMLHMAPCHASLVIRPSNSSLLATQICGFIPCTASGQAGSCTRDEAADLLGEKAGVGVVFFFYVKKNIVT